MKERIKVATSFATDEKAKGKSDSGTASMDVAMEEPMIPKPTKVFGPTKEVKKSSDRVVDVSPKTSPRARSQGQSSAVPRKRVVFDPNDL